MLCLEGCGVGGAGEGRINEDRRPSRTPLGWARPEDEREDGSPTRDFEFFVQFRDTRSGPIGANIGGVHEIVRSDRKVPIGAHRPGVHVARLVRKEPPAKGSRTGVSQSTLLTDGEPAGSMQTQLGLHNLISWSGRDRGSPVSHHDASFEFTGRLSRVAVSMHDDQKLDGDGVGSAQMARQ